MCCRLLRDLAAPGRVVVVATHDDRLLPLADRVVELTPRVRRRGTAPRRSSSRRARCSSSRATTATRVYVVDSGEIEIFRVLDDGTDERVALIEPGNYFGELAPMFGLRRSAGARAHGGPAVVTGLGLRDFRATLGSTAGEFVTRD